MKRVAIVLTAVIALCAASNAPADGQADNKPTGQRLAHVPGGQMKSPAAWYIESIDKIVSLTDAQKKAITAFMEARDAIMKDFQTRNAERMKAASNAMMEAYKSKDAAAIAKAQKAYQEIWAPMTQIMKNSQADLASVLTAEQTAKLRDHRLMTVVKSMTDPIKLSEEQIKQLRAACKGLALENTYEGGWPKFNEALQKVLTAQQKHDIAKHRAMMYVKGMFQPAKLTAEQIKKAEAACDELLKAQPPKMLWDYTIVNKLNERVTAILSDGQKASLAKARRGWQGLGGMTAPAAAAKKPESDKPAPTQPFQIIIAEGDAVVLKAEGGKYWLGINVSLPSPELRKKLALPPHQGLVVDHVLPKSPADKLLQPHDVILQAGGAAIKGVGDLVAAIQQAKGHMLPLQLNRDGKPLKVVVKPAKRPGDGLVFQLPGAPAAKPKAAKSDPGVAALVELNKRLEELTVEVRKLRESVESLKKK
jgi:Spy/CpxP family protein refolding chaperone